MNADPHRDPERLRDDLAAYALGALDRDDAAELERHLDGCESCMARLRWLDPAVGLLPAAVPQLTPPDSLRENLIATVRAEAAPVTPSASEPDSARRSAAPLAARPRRRRLASRDRVRRPHPARRRDRDRLPGPRR